MKTIVPACIILMSFMALVFAVPPGGSRRRGETRSSRRPTGGDLGFGPGRRRGRCQGDDFASRCEDDGGSIDCGDADLTVVTECTCSPDETICIELQRRDVACACLNEDGEDIWGRYPPSCHVRSGDTVESCCKFGNFVINDDCNPSD